MSFPELSFQRRNIIVMSSIIGAMFILLLYMHFNVSANTSVLDNGIAYEYEYDDVGSLTLTLYYPDGVEVQYSNYLKYDTTLPSTPDNINSWDYQITIPDKGIFSVGRTGYTADHSGPCHFDSISVETIRAFAPDSFNYYWDLVSEKENQ